jgi:hypothetical protein
MKSARYQRHRTALGVFIRISLLLSSVCFAEEPTADAQPANPPASTTKQLGPIQLGPDDKSLNTHAQRTAPTAFASKNPRPGPTWGTGNGQSYLVPAFDIVGEEFLLNQFDRHFVDSQVYGSSVTSFKRNLRGSWPVDTDPFNINQFAHPYQGGIYFGLARSGGLGFWQSMGYAFMGSALWELAGETGPGSINDQFTTTVGGTFLGEPLFRMASLVLESGQGEPGFWRELGAAAISPATGFNRLAWGNRFRGVFASHDPAVYTRILFGVNATATVHSNVNVNPDAALPAIPQGYQRGEVMADFTMDYGLPGKPGYTYDRPYDNFHFQFTAASSNVFENIMSRGLLYGGSVAAGDNYRGVWGLYGSYDYIAPQIFRISNTGIGPGITGQWWLSRHVAWQSSAMATVGYGSAGTINGVGTRDYHDGLAVAGLLSSRFIFGDWAALELNLRDYDVTGLGSSEIGGAERIARGDLALTVRLFNLHGLTIRYVGSRRDAHYLSQDPTHQSVGVVSIGYTLLGHTRFGAVDWRPRAEGGP